LRDLKYSKPEKNRSSKEARKQGGKSFEDGKGKKCTFSPFTVQHKRFIFSQNCVLEYHVFCQTTNFIKGHVFVSDGTSTDEHDIEQHSFCKLTPSEN
jgi:hypothetical protein